MYTPAEKTNRTVTAVQQRAAGGPFFRKAGEADKEVNQPQPFFAPSIQAKLSVSSPDDPQEKEADAVADHVMRMPEPVSIAAKEEEGVQRKEEDKDEKLHAKMEAPVITLQRKCASCEKEDNIAPKLFRKLQRSEEAVTTDEAIQCKQMTFNHAGTLQRSGRAPPQSSISQSFEQQLSSSKGAGSALSGDTRQFMESRFNADFGSVRIHTGQYAENLSGQINAQAFAHGNDIYFNTGKYSPHTEAGGTLLAHELTHTVQQGASPAYASSTVATKKSVQKKNEVNFLLNRNLQTAQTLAQYNPRQLWEQRAKAQRGDHIAKPASIETLQHNAFNISRQEENENTSEIEVHTKQELSSWQVNGEGTLYTGPPMIQKAANENELQQKEEDKKEEEQIKDTAAPGLQKKALDQFAHQSTAINRSAANELEPGLVQTNSGYSDSTIQHQDNIPLIQASLQHERGPPTVQHSAGETIHRSVVDDALNFVSGSSLLGCISITDPDATAACLLQKASEVAMHIPGYRALRVVLGSDPVSGERVLRNGRNFIQAAFDIMPGGELLYQKLEEQHQLDAAATWIDTRIAELENIVAGVSSSFSRFWNGLSPGSLLSPMEVMRDGANIVLGFLSRIIAFAENAAAELLQMVKDFLLNTLVDFIKEQTTAYPLLTVILGEDPITKQPVARNGTNILNALLELGGEEGIQQRQQMRETGTFQRIVGYVDEGIAVFGGLYDAIVQNFSAIWNELSIESLMSPVASFRRIYNVFAEPVQRVLAFVIRVGIEILKLIKEVLMQRLSAWARTTRGFTLVTVLIGRDPFTNAVVPFTVQNVIHGFFSLMEGGEEQYNQLNESGAIGRTVAKINAAVARLNMTPAAIIQLFTDLWNSFSLNDLAHPVAAFQRIIDRFGEPIGRLIAFVFEIVKIVVEAILIVMNFPFDLINNIIRRAMAAIERIKRDPVAFLKNLLRAIKQGFIQFFDNIVTHLINGVVGWLMSELRDAGVPALTDFSLRGVIAWVLQVLGISMERIWEKLAAHPRIGPQRVARIRSMINTLEGIWTFIRDVQERGMAAIWERIQEQLSNLWNTILDAVKNWVMEQIVNRIVARLLSMLDPTGIMAVVNSTIAIYSAIQSFIRYLREILEVVNSFVNGVADIAEGNVTTAANYLERTMGRAMPVVIGFLANQVGLAGIGRRVGEMIVSVREMVDQALTWLVNRAVDTAFNVIDRLMGRGGEDTSAAGNVRERSKARLNELVADTDDQSHVETKIQTVLNELRPQGLRDLRLMPDTQNEGTFFINATASPPVNIMKLIPKMAGRRPTARLAATISSSEDLSFIVQSHTIDQRFDIHGQIITLPKTYAVGERMPMTEVRRLAVSAGQTREFASIERSGGSWTMGGAILVPEPGAREIQVAAWNTDTNAFESGSNHSHAEYQFRGWLRSQSPTFLSKIKGISVNINLSPCDDCCGTLYSAINDTPGLMPETLNIGWSTAYCRAPIPHRRTTQSGVAVLSAPITKDQRSVRWEITSGGNLINDNCLENGFNKENV